MDTASSGNVQSSGSEPEEITISITDEPPLEGATGKDDENEIILRSKFSCTVM